MNTILVIFVFLVAAGVFYLFWHATAPVQVQSIQQKIDSQIAPITGDKLDIYIPVKPLADISQQISTNPLIPQQFKSYLGTTLLGNDSHGNLLIKNQSNIINSSSLNPNATAYLKAHPELFANTQNVSSVGYNYGSISQNTGTLTPQSTDSVHAGQTYHIFGKLYLYDKTKCNVVTQNGQSTTQCPVIIAPYNFRIQIEAVDSDPYRLAYLADKLPTTHQETNPDGTFAYNWQTLSDKYYVGNYNAHFWVESETIVNGQTVTDEFDHAFTILGQ